MGDSKEQKLDFEILQRQFQYSRNTRDHDAFNDLTKESLDFSSIDPLLLKDLDLLVANLRRKKSALVTGRILQNK